MCLACKLVLISSLSSGINTAVNFEKGMGGGEEKGEIRERERRKSRKRRKEFHQSWLQSWSTWCSVQCLGDTQLDFVRVSIHRQVFFTLEISISLSMQVSYHAHPILLDLLGKASLGFYKSFSTQRSLQLSKILWFHYIMLLWKNYFLTCVDKASLTRCKTS